MKNTKNYLLSIALLLFNISAFSQNNVEVSQTGDAYVKINADTDNQNEDDNPVLLLTQDGGGINGMLTLTGLSSSDYSGGFSGLKTNSLLLGSTYSIGYLLFGTNSAVRMAISPSGKVGIGTSSPTYTLHVQSDDRANVCAGGPSSLTDAVGDFILRTSDEAEVNNSIQWDMSFRTDTWAHSAGDLVFFSKNSGSTYTSPLILQSDGDILLGTGNNNNLLGNVGIGDMTPDARLVVKAKSDQSVAMKIFGFDDRRFTFKTPRNSSEGFHFYVYNEVDEIREPLYIGHDQIASAPLVIKGEEGQVGIMTSDIPADFRLAVDGKILVEAVHVKNSTNWPDYVFADDYSLRSLSEVENFISRNGHLPEVPSANEVSEGFDVGQMDAALLKKIEEMTLYMIQLEKKNTTLEKQNSDLEQRLQRIEQLLNN